MEEQLEAEKVLSVGVRALASALSLRRSWAESKSYFIHSPGANLIS